MSADKARMLGALEMFMGDHLSDDSDAPKLNIGTDAVLQAAGEVFGVPNGNGEHAQRWKTWFNGRFLPVFLLWAGTLRKRTNKKNLLEASESFAASDQLALARAIIGAQGIDTSGAKTSIWNITSNPWPDAYEMNTDSDTTAGNLEAIRLLADKVRLGEVTAKTTIKQGNEDESKAAFGWFKAPRGGGTKDPNQKSQTPGLTSRSASATGDAITGKDAKPISGMGDPVRFTGGGGGNYTDLPQPGGAGWSANRDLILKAAAMAGVDPKALIATIAVESGFDPNAAPKNPNLPSSAKGFGQHLDSSWLEDMGRGAKKFGIPNGTNQFDGRASVLMTATRLKYNAEALEKRIKRSVTVTDLYLAHLMGLGGAGKFLTAPEDAIAAETAPTTAKQHPDYFYDGSRALTVKETYAKIAAKLAKRPAEFGVTDADMKTNSGPSSDGAASTTTAAAPAAAPAATGQQSGSAGTTQSAAQSRPGFPVKASFDNTPSAGSAKLSTPVVMADGKAAVVGTGPAIVKSADAKYEVVLQREESEDDGMYGTLRLPDGTTLNTLELPWRDNEPRLSSIPPGIYPCKKRPSAAFGEAYEVQKVQGRSAILIHAGNSAGSVDKGMKANSQGCILLGMDRGRQGNQKVITASKAAMQLFYEKMQGMDFTLIIRPGKNNLGTSDKKAGMSFDPVRQPQVNTTPQPGVSPSASTSAFTPTATRANTTSVPMATSADLPRATTVGGFVPGGPTKADMKGRDAAISETIAPKLDGMSDLLSKSLGVQSDSLGVLKQIATALAGSVADKTQSVSANKVRAQTDTPVPVPQRRSTL
jgi:hypothetical protein